MQIHLIGFLILGVETILEGGSTNGTNIWKGNENTTTLLFFLKGLDILHKGRRGQVNTIVMEYFKIILFHKFEPAKKQHANK